MTAATFRDLMSETIREALARSLAGPKTRSIDPARMPMMTRVIKISTRVKPFLFPANRQEPKVKVPAFIRVTSYDTHVLAVQYF
jgi:hypothetical protein